MDTPESPILPQQQPFEAPPTPSPAPQLAKIQSTVAPSASSPVPVASVQKKQYAKRNKKVVEGMLSYTTAFVPGTLNVRNPAGSYLQKETNVDVARQMSLERAKREGEAEKSQRETKDEAPENALSKILIIHPGSRNLRVGLASDFYPKEIPNCIARPTLAVRSSGADEPPAIGSRIEKMREHRRKIGKRKRDGSSRGEDDNTGNSQEEDIWIDPVDETIGYLRDYLRNRLVQGRLNTDFRELNRTRNSNAKVKPELLPELNDPHKLDYTDPEGKPYFVGNDALRLPQSAGYIVRYPIMNRALNCRDYASPQTLMDDISTILAHLLLTEFDIFPKQYRSYSVMLIVPDHGDRVYTHEMAHLILKVLGFKALAVQQESYCAIFGTGMSSACVVDIGAQTTSVTCIDEALLIADTRIKLAYGGDDITSALYHLLQAANFPYRELDLGHAQDWLIMNNLKDRMCTYEEHLVASTPWEFYVSNENGKTQKWIVRTFDENILAPLDVTDKSQIDFEEKGFQKTFHFWDDLWETVSAYEEPTGAMRACCSHLLPAAPATSISGIFAVKTEAPSLSDSGTATPAPSGIHSTNPSPEKGKPNTEASATSDLNSASITPAASTPALGPVPTMSSIPTMASLAPPPSLTSAQIFDSSSRSPLDAAIATSLATCGTETKVRTLSNSIVLIGGSSSIKGLSSFISDRLLSLLRQKGIEIGGVSIVPPPRGLNPRYVSWKGGSVMCHFESLQDMWIRGDEYDAIGARALKDRYIWL
nr:nuclear protein [Cryptococcus depauperatus CBS 7841]